MEKINETMMTNTILKTDGANPFTKTPKYCEFCGEELVQTSFMHGTQRKYVPSWQPCECKQAKAARDNIRKVLRQKEREEKAIKSENRRKEKIEALLGTSGMSPRAKNCVFEGYQLNIYNSDAFNLCKKYSENFDSIKKTKKNGIFLAGPCGVGKSHLAYSIANSLINKGQSVISMTMIDLLMHIRRSYDSSGQKSESDILKVYEDCTLLVIDDLGKEKPTEWTLSMIYTIIDRRYNSYKPVIVTTNYSAGELIDRLTIGADSSSAHAIVDRLFETCIYVPIKGESFRRNQND